jgi:hypothetical protein
MTITVSSLFLYPVKGCAGVPVDRLSFDRFGPIGDRRWLVVDAADRFITQREHPRLVLLRAELVEGGVRLTTPEGASVEARATADAPTRSVVIWRDQVEASDAGDAAAALLSDFLGTPVRLVGIGPAYQRQIDPARARAGEQVTFADGYPMLVVGEASLADLNQRGQMALPMARFRPNIVLSGTTAFEEDTWSEATIGACEVALPKPCARCAVPTVDPATGRFDGKEPLRTLATFRRGEDGAVFFGMNAIVRAGTVIEIGDLVRPRVKR